MTDIIILSILTDITPGPFNEFYPAFKKGLTGGQSKTLKNWKAASVFSKIEKKASNRVYHRSQQQPSQPYSSRNNDRNNFLRGNNPSHNNGHGYHSSSTHQLNRSTSLINNNILEDHNCLVIGGGPCGLRTAIELQLLGSKRIVVVEKRDRFSRNNVLHLWPFVIQDLKLMAGKKFYGKFCAGELLL